MINQKELAICNRRGHDGAALVGWTQCRWCGTWRREVRTIEERADEPPEGELDGLVKIQRLLPLTRGGKPAGKRDGKPSARTRRSGAKENPAVR
jgi:hypothetical protein